MKILRTGLLAIVTTLAISTSALAVPLLPGGVIFPAGDTVVTAPNTAGVVRNDNLLPFSFDITAFTGVGGNVQNRVAESSLLNTMVFAPRIRDTYNTATRNFMITGFRLDGYAGWDTDVGYRTDGLGDRGPSVISRSAGGGKLTFRYLEGSELSVSGLLGGTQEESLFPYITTDAPSYELTGTMTLFGYDVADRSNLLSVELAGLAVPASVPEPSAIWLLGSGLLGLLGFTRQRKQAV
ncbi:MAG: PEP-CTERM sorting domain-containing protein [Candidatus Thiodiazotropha sp. (ex Myrtea spinifera)]|nr:PEP-CTERM sorting domain-containing protein [Candidatus Thiodiazotropha sp. (ex Myrtea spinifera)]